MLDGVRQRRLGLILRWFAEITSRIRVAIGMRKDQPQPFYRTRYLELQDPRQNVVARHSKLRAEIRNLSCQHADALDHRDPDSMQQNQTPTLRGLGRLDRL